MVKTGCKYCIGFDAADPTPEREWFQFRDEGDHDAAVRAAVRTRLGDAGVPLNAEGSATVLTVSVVTGMAAGPSQPIGVQELKSLSELNRSADGPALKPGWGFAEREAERERKEAEWAARQEKHAADVAARRERREEKEREEREKTMALIEEPWRRLREQAAAIPEIAMAAVSASAAAMLVRPDAPMSDRVEAAEAAGRKAMW